MSNASTPEGPATVEQFQELLGLLVSQLTKRLREGPTAADLSVARLALADQGRLGLVLPVERKRLDRLYGLLVRERPAIPS